jgi:hypothetical protein
MLVESSSSGDEQGWPGRPQRNDYRLDRFIMGVKVSRHDCWVAGARLTIALAMVDGVAQISITVAEGSVAPLHPDVVMLL